MRHRVITTTALALVALAVPSATAMAADRDHDRMPDKWEKHFKLNPRKNDARRDRDRDGLRNIDEFRAGTNPRDRDTDNDGVRDDNEGAGTIKSFDASTGVLVIDLFDSTTDLTGKVDATTKIECDDEGDDDNSATRSRDGAGDNSGPGNAGDGGDDDGDRSGSNSGPSDNSGPGNTEQGDDDDRGDDDETAQPACDASSLDVGRVVKEAKLNEGDDGPADVFHEIELVR